MRVFIIIILGQPQNEKSILTRAVIHRGTRARNKMEANASYTYILFLSLSSILSGRVTPAEEFFPFGRPG